MGKNFFGKKIFFCHHHVKSYDDLQCNFIWQPKIANIEASILVFHFSVTYVEKYDKNIVQKNFCQNPNGEIFFIDESWFNKNPMIRSMGMVIGEKFSSKKFFFSIFKKYKLWWFWNAKNHYIIIFGGRVTLYSNSYIIWSKIEK